MRSRHSPRQGAGRTLAAAMTAGSEQSIAVPAGFLWGAATAAYQVEGAAREGGRGESIWDHFAAKPGKVRAGDTGEVACDFYHRYRGDVDLMRELGIDAFRFSIAWPRVMPEGRGRVEPRGLDFYDRLVDSLLEAGVRPFPTLYHWDLPQALEDTGGWTARATAEAFVEYAEAVVGRLGDRVSDWTTHNEPFCSAWLGYVEGLHAPGRHSIVDGLAATHHVLLSHGLAAEAIRREARGSRVGIVLDCVPIHAASDAPADREAARLVDALRNRLYFDPVFKGAYPEEVLEYLAPAAPPLRRGDLETIAAPIDFLGVNNYSRRLVRAATDGPVDVCAPSGTLTATGWEVYPQGLYEVLTRVQRDYAPPLVYVTENGAAYADVRTHDGRVHDPERISYLDGYLRAMARAASEGVPVAGYFVWSLLDNFEWAEGYAKRFGLVFVDYPTQERVPKDSFAWYKDTIARARGYGTASTPPLGTLRS